MTTNSHPSTTETKPKWTKQTLEQEEIHRNRDHMDGYQRVGAREEWWKSYRE